MGDDRRFLPDEPLDTLVAGALDGDRSAWDALVERLHRVVWKAVNMMTTDPHLRDDAFATTWLRLAERLDTIEDPEKLPGWLTTTATNEVRQQLRRKSRTDVSLTPSWRSAEPGGAADLLDRLPAAASEPGAGLESAERRREVRAAFARLDDDCREVITVLVLSDPPLRYDEASRVLGRPVGSLGPTRGRCLDKMKRLLDPAPPGTTPTKEGRRE
ncbi:MAG: sigma-70 family RNA polymerase sigma factor [Ilumatobacter sp.]|nr:sigma-70 family RNA polymerase sigma factor [Ilumatobacter sp.]